MSRNWLRRLDSFVVIQVRFLFTRVRVHHLEKSSKASVQFSSVAQSCLTLFDPMDCSTPGFPVHHQLLELTQTHVHQGKWCHPTTRLKLKKASVDYLCISLLGIPLITLQIKPFWFQLQPWYLLQEPCFSCLYKLSPIPCILSFWNPINPMGFTNLIFISTSHLSS